MARTSLQDVNGLPDPLLSYNFDLIFPSIPGGGDTRSMTVKCMSTAIPGMQLEQQTVGLHGVEVNYAGRQIWTKSFQAVFVETRDGSTRRNLRNWVEFARNNRQNAGNYKAQYSVAALLQLYDDIPNIIETTKIIGCWPMQIDDVAMDGSQGTVVQVSCTFSFDWTEPA
jgi:hypothetical protein